MIRDRLPTRPRHLPFEGDVNENSGRTSEEQKKTMRFSSGVPPEITKGVSVVHLKLSEKEERNHGLYRLPVLRHLLPSNPPQTIIWLPVQAAVWPYLPAGAPATEVRDQVSVAGL